MAPTDFWNSSGFFMLERNGDGLLVASDDFLRAYLNRPEIRPIAESCADEIFLHERLIENPRMEVVETDILAMADPDTRDNYQIVLRFRDLLLAEETLEASYLALMRRGVLDVPPIFVDQLVHAILRNALEGIEDPLQARAAELLFRTQKATVQDGAVMLADEEIVEQFAQAGGMTPIAQLMAGTVMDTVNMDVLDRDNARIYWARSDQFDTVLDFTFTRPGLDAFCRVLESWVAHFLDVEVNVQPVQSIRDEKWVWHTGLDTESTTILNELYEARNVDEDRMARLLSLFRLEFKDPAVMLGRVAGRPVYMGLAMNADRVVRMKPQNLLLNLPLAVPS